MPSNHFFFFFFNDTATTEIYTLSLHDALPTYRLRASTYMQVAMLVPYAVEAKKKRWALVYPNFEYGQSAAAWFKQMMKQRQPDVEFVTEQATPLGKVDAGPVVQALADSRPDGIFNVLFGPDLSRFVREGNTRGLFEGKTV